MLVNFVILLASVATAYVPRSATPPTNDDQSLAPPHPHGLHGPSESYTRMLRELTGKEASKRDSDTATTIGINVDVWFHAVSGEEKTLASEESLLADFQILQDGYAPYNISFSYMGYTRTVNPDWAVDISVGDKEMRRSLRKGDYQTLNYYVIDHVPNWFRRCSFPTSVTEGEDAFINDGCVFQVSLQGKQVIQTTGHWFGLLMTNAGYDCDGEGDLIDDTPAELQYQDSFGCPLDLDTCPDHPGLDAVQNYMSPSSDWCWTHFTQGQIIRIQSVWEQFRAKL